MILPLTFRPAAQKEFNAAAAWYENHRAGLGIEFIDEVQKIVDAIARHPDRYPIASGDVREAPVSRFPYCVYYRAKLQRVVVIAVFHTARDPAIWQART
jgi:plasmid stabilization system protein ParE